MDEYTTLEQVKIRLKQFHIETVTDEDGVTSDVVVFDQKEDNPLNSLSSRQEMKW